MFCVEECTHTDNIHTYVCSHVFVCVSFNHIVIRTVVRHILFYCLHSIIPMFNTTITEILLFRWHLVSSQSPIWIFEYRFPDVLNNKITNYPILCIRIFLHYVGFNDDNHHN